MSINFDINFVREYTVPGVENVFHMSFDKSGGMWFSDSNGTIVKTDQHGELIYTQQTTGGRRFERNGFHTVTNDGELIYIDRSTAENVIMRRAANNTITTFIETGLSTPYCVHSSRFNRDILVGMIDDKGDVNVTRYDENGVKQETIEYDNAESNLYSYPIYITENDNKFVCVSDYYLNAVVVVRKNRARKFNYGVVQNTQGFKPYGICAYNSQTIFVCDEVSEKIHLVKHKYRQIRTESSYPISSLQELSHPRALCLDNDKYLHVGQSHSKKVRVYKFEVDNCY